MDENLKNQDAIFDETVQRMKKLGTYRPEFDMEIRIYSEMIEQYRAAIDDWRNDGAAEFQVKGSDGRAAKSPFVRSMEALRRDIASYSNLLGLNPKAHEALDVKQEKTSRLADALRQLK